MIFFSLLLSSVSRVFRSSDVRKSGDSSESALLKVGLTKVALRIGEKVPVFIRLLNIDGNFEEIIGLTSFRSLLVI